MAPTLRHRVVFSCILAVIVRYSSAGPLLRLKRQVHVAVENPVSLESLCIVGEVKYERGAAVPSDACDQCVCGGNSSVECTRVACDPAPGCKALHRPDHCCPLYQCECEVDGRVFANGEKRIDPVDPCSVCYCQGGDFACSRLACFRRDDCEARFHPGRCCPEYDHCPIRGASTEPNQHSNVNFGDKKQIEVEEPEIIHQKKEITIKEITPVSEIPSVTGIRIKEILKPSNLEVSEYNYDGTKSPLIPREALYNQTKIEPAVTTEGLKTSGEGYSTSPNPSSAAESETTDKVLYIKLGNLGYKNKGASTPATVIKVIGAEGLQRGEEEENIENNLEFAHSIEPNVNYEQLESKTDNATNVENVTLILTEVVNELYRTTTTESSDSTTTSTSNSNSIQSTDKSSVAQQYTEEDLPLVDHNPEFPPIPDDIMVLNVPDDNTDLSPETLHLEVDHGSHSNAENIVLVKRPVFSLPSYQDKIETNKVSNENDKPKILQEVLPLVKINGSNTSDVTTIMPEEWLKSTASDLKTSPLLNLETAIPQDILSLPAETINDDEIKISNISYAIEFDKDTTTTEEPTTTTTGITEQEIIMSTSEKNESEKKSVWRKIDILPVHTTDVTTPPEPSMRTTNSDSTDNTSTTSNLPSTSTNEETENTNTGFSPDDTGTTSKELIGPLDSTVGIEETNYVTATNGPNTSLSHLIIKEVLASSTPDPSYTTNGFSTSPTITTQGYSTTSLNADDAAQSLLSRSTENPLKVYEVTEKSSTDLDTSGISRQGDSLSTLGFSIKEVGFKAQSTVGDINAPSKEIETTMIPPEYISKIKSTDAPNNKSVTSEPAGKLSTVANGKSNNILADLISLVEDVATIGSRKSDKNSQDSLQNEEFILTSLNGTAKEIDSGFTLDPITDTDNDDESTSTTDRREETTKKPIIDDVSDVNLQQLTTEGLKDVEFVPKVNVPTLETMPKKLVTEEIFVTERSTSTHHEDTSPTISTISLLDQSSEALSMDSTTHIEASTKERTETTSEIFSSTASI